MADQFTLRAYIEVLPRKCTGLAQFAAVGHILALTLWSDAYPRPEWALLTSKALGERVSMSAKAFDFALEDAARRGLVEKRRMGRNCLYKPLPHNWATVADHPRPVRESRAERRAA